MELPKEASSNSWETLPLQRILRVADVVVDIAHVVAVARSYTNSSVFVTFFLSVGGSVSVPMIRTDTPEKQLADAAFILSTAERLMVAQRSGAK